MSTEADRNYTGSEPEGLADPVAPARPVVPAGPKGDRANEEWERARHRVQAKREFSSHLVAFVVVNLALIGVWLVTGAGYFWPAWVIFAWGAGLVLHAWDVYRRRPITRADIDAEMHRGRHYLTPTESVQERPVRAARPPSSRSTSDASV